MQIIAAFKFIPATSFLTISKVHTQTHTKCTHKHTHTAEQMLKPSEATS